MNVKDLVPKDKHDKSNIDKLYYLTDKEIKPIIYDLLEWLQDYNWPVAEEIKKVLWKRENLVFPYISSILNSDDEQWKYWIIELIIPLFNCDHKKQLKKDLWNIINTTSDYDLKLSALNCYFNITKTNNDDLMNEEKGKYISTFFSELSDKDKEEIHFYDFMWHAFSYEKISCLSGVDALNEFKKRKNNNVYIINQQNNDVIEMVNLTYERLLELIFICLISPDCYVIDKNFKWTFVFTHETIINNMAFLDPNDSSPYYIGPFFKEINEK